MPPIRRIGFFHFGGADKRSPVTSLEIALNKTELEDSLENSLIVLPEGFNVLGGYYAPPPVKLDALVSPRLQALSVSRTISFVVGLIEQETGGVKGYNSAYLVDESTPPLLLSRKRCGRGPHCLYPRCPKDEGVAVLRRGIGITALLCDDAGETENQKPTLARVESLHSDRNVLCIPACMTITDSLAIAKLWEKSITVVLANGSASFSSVIIHQGCELISGHPRNENQIKLCDL
jgi:predicted amidohydrolase